MTDDFNAAFTQPTRRELLQDSNSAGDRWNEVLPVDGAGLLDDVAAFLARFIAYPSDAAWTAHTLWIVHAHLMDCWESTPRIAFLSPEPGSGKSRCLEVTEPLVPRAVHAVNTTPAYLFRKVSDPAGPPTILYDEIDTVFGPRAKDNEDVRGMLNAGHRKGATAGRCVVRGRTVDTEELPAYCAVALAGLDDLPDTLMSRSVVVRMRRRAPSERVEPWRLRVNGPQAARLYSRIADWAEGARGAVDGAWPDLPEQVQDRDADVWEALVAVADAAGGRWPQLSRVSAVTHVTDTAGHAPSLGVKLLADLRQVFDGREVLPTTDILAGLLALDEAPWGDLRGRELDARGLSRRLAKYGIKPKVHRTGSVTARGYAAADLVDTWRRYLPDEGKDSSEDTTTTVPQIPPIGIGTEGNGALPMPPEECVTGVTSVTSTFPSSPSEPPSTCAICGQPLLLTGPGRTICARTDADHRQARSGAA